MKKYILLCLLATSSVFALDANTFLNNGIEKDKIKVNTVVLSMNKDKKHFYNGINKLKKMSDNGNGEASFELGVFNEMNKRYDNAINFYKKAISQGNSGKSEYNLGLLYIKLDKKCKTKCQNYLLDSIKHGITKSYTVLAEYTNNEKYYQEAVKYKLPLSNTIYSNYLKKNNRLKKAKEYAKKAYLNKESYIPYYNFVKNKDMKLKILKTGVKNNDINSIEELAYNYIIGKYVKKDLNKAEYLLKPLNSDFSNYLMGIVYLEKNKYKESLDKFNMSKIDSKKYKEIICNKRPALCLKF